MPVPISDKPYWTSPDGEKVKIYLGDVRKMLGVIPAKSIQCVVTSPPYWGLRDYGTGEWVGGDKECDHASGRRNQNHEGSIGPKDTAGNAFRNSSRYVNQGSMSVSNTCNRCGAKRIDRQIGSEPSPDCGTHGQAQCGQCFICTMVEVFRGVYKVLRDDGCLWLNLGDTYGDGGQLQGIPWRVALALQYDGWILRQDIIWSKMSPMPESVRNRCTKAHEYVFLLTKKMGYYYDADAVKEPSKSQPHAPGKKLDNSRNDRSSMENIWGDGKSKKRSVWHLSSESYPGSHFATYPKKLVEPCILAGTSAKGACAKCGAPWERVVEDLPPENGRQFDRSHTESNPYIRHTSLDAGSSGAVWPKKTIGWQPTCECFGKVVKQTVTSDPPDEEETTISVYEPRIPLEHHPIVPCKVLDPFAGSGTTAVVSMQHGRIAWGIELSKQYVDLHIIPRLNRVATNPLAESKAFKELNNRLGSKLSQKDKIPKRK